MVILWNRGKKSSFSITINYAADFQFKGQCSQTLSKQVQRLNQFFLQQQQFYFLWGQNWSYPSQTGGSAQREGERHKVKDKNVSSHLLKFSLTLPWRLTRILCITFALCKIKIFVTHVTVFSPVEITAGSVSWPVCSNISCCWIFFWVTLYNEKKLDLIQELELWQLRPV